jgi:hypothetical protein
MNNQYLLGIVIVIVIVIAIVVYQNSQNKEGFEMSQQLKDFTSQLQTNIQNYEAETNKQGRIFTQAIQATQAEIQKTATTVGVAVSTPTSAPVQSYSDYETMAKTDFGGNDIRNIDNATLQLCRENCNGDSRCLGFNHSNPAGNGTCWLKNALGARGNTDAWTFYRKLAQAPPPVVCIADGSWSAPTANPGGVITKNCSTGGIQTATCNPDGGWSIGNCPPPPPVLAIPTQVVTCKADGSWSALTANVGGNVTKNCPTGGIQTATCNPDGGWSIGNCPPVIWGGGGGGGF